jgi:hypothetical protein
LALINKQVAEEVQRLAQTLDLSVAEVLQEAVGLLDRCGLDKHRNSVRTFWDALSPEERKERASRASKARWDREKSNKSGDDPESAVGPTEARWSAKNPSGPKDDGS